MKRILLTGIALCLVLSTSLMAQITISTNTYQPSPGTVLEYPSDMGFDVTFYNSLAAGSGGPMNWDFSSRVYSTGFSEQSVDPAATPAIDSFPTGNLVFFSSVGADSTWQVYHSSSTEQTLLGNVYHGSGAELVTKFDVESPEHVFPMSHTNQWTTIKHWTQNSGITYTNHYDTTFHTVDGWGSVQYFSNSFPCLRVNSLRRYTFNTHLVSDNSLIASQLMTTTTISFFVDGGKRLIGASKVSFLGSDIYSCNVLKEFVDITTDVKELDKNLPNDFSLSQNYPNPFNPSTSIELSIPNRTHVKLSVFDILGREVKTLVDTELSAGTFSVEWDGTDNSGHPVASGIYLYSVKTDRFAESRKMILMK